MFKAMILLKRKDTLSFDDFKNHWLNTHAPLVQQLPEIRKSVFNFVSGDGSGDIDAISELWFDTQDAFTQAYASDIGKSVAQDALSMVEKRERLILEEHSIV